MYATVSMIYVVDFCRSFHASDATQDRPCEPATGTFFADHCGNTGLGKGENAPIVEGCAGKVLDVIDAGMSSSI